jgi:glycosyltransferase involved in cell wall biosynthesis
MSGRPDRRLRVLHVVLDLDAGGLQRLVVDLIRHSDAARFEHQVLTIRAPGRNAAGLAGIARVQVADPLPRWTLLYPGPLIRQIGEIAPDVLHSHSGVWYKASFAARRAGVPRLVHTDHGRPWPDPWNYHVADYLASRRTDVIVPVSQALARFLVTRLHIRGDRLRIIENGIDTTRFQPRADGGAEALRRELGLAAGIPILGSIGRFDHIKGYDVMLRAFARLVATWREGTPPVLVLAGEGPEDTRLRGLIGELGLGAHVRLLGWRGDAETLLAGFTLFTLASRSEGTSISLLEAMSSGVCPVVTAVGGNPAVLGPALRHRLVPAEDPEALMVGWRAALQDAGRRARDAAAARRRVEESYSVRRMVDAYERLYRGEEAGTRVE